MHTVNYVTTVNKSKLFKLGHKHARAIVKQTGVAYTRALSVGLKKAYKALKNSFVGKTVCKAKNLVTRVKTGLKSLFCKPTNTRYTAEIKVVNKKPKTFISRDCNRLKQVYIEIVS